ncbi:hypothetical protein [Burkholderia sp. PU8-34]
MKKSRSLAGGCAPGGAASGAAHDGADANRDESWLDCRTEFVLFHKHNYDLSLMTI